MKIAAIKLLLVISLASCGGHDEKNCLSREQARAICLAEEIQRDPNPTLLEIQKLNCSRVYPAPACY